MKYLLDTNTCIALMNARPPVVRARFDEAFRAGAQMLVSVVVVFELWYGAAKSTHPEASAHRLETFLAGPIGMLPFDEEDARAAGKIRAMMEVAGTPIGAYDLLIAGQALRRELTLVTANAREFARVKDLLWEDWAKP